MHGGNKSLNRAKQDKCDEFYTYYEDIEKELGNYGDQFAGKVVYCNCDDPSVSEFSRYFFNNFGRLRIKGLISSHYSVDRGGYRINTKDGVWSGKLRGDGDFRSKECREFLKRSDVVCTNPPFSLFREFIALMERYGKKFLVLGNINMVMSRDIFSLFMRGGVWLGINGSVGGIRFNVPDSYGLRSGDSGVDAEGRKWIKMSNIRWFTNLEVKHGDDFLVCAKRYTPECYLKYDNYDAINVDRTEDIPCDYDGVMGVPITFLDKYNPKQFEIIGKASHDTNGNDGRHWRGGCGHATIGGKCVFNRILIRRRV